MENGPLFRSAIDPIRRAQLVAFAPDLRIRVFTDVHTASVRVSGFFASIYGLISKWFYINPLH